MGGDTSVGLMGAGLTGMQRGYQMVTNAASDIAQQTMAKGGSSDLATPMVNLGVGERSTEASASVIRTADEMVGTLLDVMA
jgi:flagellar basal body rod protein FlgG